MPASRPTSPSEPLLTTVRRAFAAAPLPPPGAVVGGAAAECDQRGARALEKALAGRPAGALDPRFLKKWWSSFYYLSPDGYRHYLPALLGAALADDGDLAHEALYSLVPSYAALWIDGRDAAFEERRSDLTAAQRDAVRAVLWSFVARAHELVLQARQPGEQASEHDDAWSLGYLAAEALRWGWTGSRDRIARGVADFYRSLHRFQRPTHGDPATRALARRIEAAFAATPVPRDRDLWESQLGDEPAEYALAFRGLPRQRLHPWFLARNRAALSFFPDRAYRYYLPAFLIDWLFGGDVNPTFHLTYGLVGPKLPASHRARQLRRLRQHSARERGAIVQFLEWELAQAPAFPGELRRAIARWKTGFAGL